ncbi:MAG: protein-glutamate O-methyltransferase CheR [Thiohalocapsa sp.]|jgi:chemotaxis protein methyltransferase CheR|uniref:CheR family methyltransferase n=1 Tax=Thiohalocapsa sp. TaxID=2497641 RepID=UPI0025F54877|nr:protein-glutamate O-methyltransferase CheR [Thiohalocapsa sp.]MCG6943599.1 protein-glutamate O-methyltransferase CheR [Thiohalocapsa sp.]
MDPQQLESIEVDLLLEAIYRRYGHDFRNYARASIERRVRQFHAQSGCATLSDMLPRLLHDEAFFADFVTRFSIPVTELFRDPQVYLALRNEVMPVLRTFPFLRIWHAGCASGEEVYSLAILLDEAGLLARSTLFATDFNDTALERARAGIYSAADMGEASRAYQRAGGARSLADYYHADAQHIVMKRRLRERVTFANHNLVTDGVFTEAHLVLCRNVLIYFNQALQDRVLGLFRDTLVRGGYLCLGTRENLRFSAVDSSFEVVDAACRLYKRLA